MFTIHPYTCTNHRPPNHFCTSRNTPPPVNKICCPLPLHKQAKHTHGSIKHASSIYTLEVGKFMVQLNWHHSFITYCSVLGKHPCTAFQGATVAASLQMYEISIPGIKCSYGPKLRVMFKRSWVLTRGTTVIM